MPNSLKCRLKKLAYQGLLSEKDLSRLCTDNDVVDELEKIKRKLILKLSEHFDFGIEEALNVIDEELSELKGGAE